MTPPMTAPEREGLLPCPFCGSEPTPDVNIERTPERHWLYCANEDCHMDVMTRNYPTPEAAAAAWNTRGMEDDVTTLYDKLAKSHPSLTRGQVWCRSCGATRNVSSEHCLMVGWPKCCGQTMTIDSPAEQAALRSRP